VFGHYGRSCACCGTAENLTIDHVLGGGRAHLKGLGLGGGDGFYRWLIGNDFPAGFQTLCGPCNGSKGEGARCRRWHERSVTTSGGQPTGNRTG
jgi:hypothetical protein